MSVDLSLSETTTIYCSFTGTSDYEACTSNSVTVTVITPLYNPTLDGTEAFTQIQGTTIVENGEMYGGSGYLTDGWDNTIDWKFECDIKFMSNQCGLILKRQGVNIRDRSEIFILLSDLFNGAVNIYTGSASSGEVRDFTNINQTNTSYHLTIIKQGTNYTIQHGDIEKTYSWNESFDTICVGHDTWVNNNCHISNIIVTEI